MSLMLGHPVPLASPTQEGKPLTHTYPVHIFMKKVTRQLDWLGNMKGGGRKREGQSEIG